MSTNTNCTTVLPREDGHFQRLRARLLRSNQQEGKYSSLWGKRLLGPPTRLERITVTGSFALTRWTFRFCGDGNLVSASNNDQKATEAMEQLTSRLRRTASNVAFLMGLIGRALTA